MRIRLLCVLLFCATACSSNAQEPYFAVGFHIKNQHRLIKVDDINYSISIQICDSNSSNYRDMRQEKLKGTLFYYYGGASSFGEKLDLKITQLSKNETMEIIYKLCFQQKTLMLEISLGTISFKEGVYTAGLGAVPIKLLK